MCIKINIDFSRYCNKYFILFLGIVEEENVYIRFVHNGEPTTKFVGIESPETADAGGLFSAIKKALSNLDNGNGSFPEQFYKKLVNVNFDGAAVMSGHKTGVQKRFKDHQPGAVYTHCVAHRLELSVLDALKFDDKYLEKFNDIINDIFRFYYRSAVRRKELQQIADLYDAELKKLGLLKQIRWIASRSRALSLLEVNYPILVYDLESKAYGSNETAKKASGYVKFLKQPKFLFYLHFLQDLVAILKSVSLKFQEDTLLMCEIPRIVSDLQTHLDTLTISPGESFMRLKNELKLDTVRRYDLMYKGEILNKPEGRNIQDIEHTPEGYETYYMGMFETIVSNTQKYIKKRFADFEETPLKQLVALFDIKSWPKSFKENKKWGLEELREALEYYEQNGYITDSVKSLALKQWLIFRNRLLKFKNEKLVDIFTDVLREKDEDIKDINILLEIMMTISCSTAACERGFSCMNIQKHNLRTSLSHASLDNIMRIHIDGVPLSKFNPEKHYVSWIKNTPGFRHIDGHQPPTKKRK